MKASRELELKLTKDIYDIQEVDRILTYILCYPTLE
jgi:hypothetical protein